MNITVYGAAGTVGWRITREALARGHNVTGVVRTKAQFDKLPDNVRPCATDVSDPQYLAIPATPGLCDSLQHPVPNQPLRYRQASSAYRTGNPYISPPSVHCAFSPRSICNGLPLPTLRSKLSP
ncbi:NAD(P)H-binding protein [Pusillimonas sp. T7-7]|uniref:NAD(P)H-binding protein n=1 Tax=Pusillimonas sp. (strain T7-7) TaxID=1007105 RepID=UPI000A016A25